MANNLTVGEVGNAVVVTFVRPDVRNPLSMAVLEELHAIVDGTPSPIVFTGTKDAFASGADLREIKNVTASSASEFASYGQSLMNKIAQRDAISIAAINGFCFGGALDLALSCRFRVCSLNARFAHPGTGLGIITGWGGTQRLPRLIGTTRALEMFFTAEPIDASTAQRFGLVDEIVEDVLTRALEIVRTIKSDESEPQLRA
jgi:enoyl-CoA hydratase